MREPGRQQREVCVGLIARDDGEGALQPLEGLVEPARVGLHLGEPARDAGRGVCISLVLVECDRLAEQPERVLGPSRVPGERTGPVEEFGSCQRPVREPGGLLEVALRLGGGAERGCPFAGPGEHRLRLLLDLGRVVGLRRRLVGGEVVGGDDLDHLVLLAGEGGGQVLGRSQVAVAAVALGERLVGNVADEVLQEAVLAVLGRARVGLDAEHLLAHERGEEQLELRLGEAGESREPGPRECLAEHGPVLEQAPLRGGEAVEARRDQGVQRLWHLERADFADRPVDRTLPHEQAAVEQHPHRLDRVERDALGPREDLLAHRFRQAGDEPGQELLHRVRRERLEVERAEVAMARAPGRPALEQLWACERDHVERGVA